MDALKFFWEYSFMGLYGVTLALAVVRFPRYYDSPLRYLPILMAYILLTETVGIIIRDNNEFSIVIRDLYYNNNWLIYNILILVEFGFFFFVYSKYITAYRLGWLKTGGLALFLVSVIGNAWLHDFTTVSQVYMYWVGGLVLCILGLLYLLQEFHHAPRKRLGRNLLVWLTAGFLLFNLFYMPIKYLRFLVVAEGMEYFAWIRPVHLGAIYLKYGLFLAGLIRMKPMKSPGVLANGNGNNKNGHGNGIGHGNENGPGNDSGTHHGSRDR